MTNSSVYQKWMEANPSTFKSQIRLRTLDYKRAFYGTPMQAWYEDGKYIGKKQIKIIFFTVIKTLSGDDANRF